MLATCKLNGLRLVVSQNVTAIVSKPFLRFSRIQFHIKHYRIFHCNTWRNKLFICSFWPGNQLIELSLTYVGNDVSQFDPHPAPDWGRVDRGRTLLSKHSRKQIILQEITTSSTFTNTVQGRSLFLELRFNVY